MQYGQWVPWRSLTQKCYVTPSNPIGNTYIPTRHNNIVILQLWSYLSSYENEIFPLITSITQRAQFYKGLWTYVCVTFSYFAPRTGSLDRGIPGSMDTGVYLDASCVCVVYLIARYDGIHEMPTTDTMRPSIEISHDPHRIVPWHCANTSTDTTDKPNYSYIYIYIYQALCFGVSPREMAQLRIPFGSWHLLGMARLLVLRVGKVEYRYGVIMGYYIVLWHFMILCGTI